MADTAEHHTTLRVALEDRGYDLVIGSGSLANAGAFLADRGLAQHAAVVTDATVGRLYAEAVSAALASAGIRVSQHVVPAGEPSKSPARLFALWEELLAAGVDRTSAVVALGGGVVGDLAGFAAASFARGLPFVQIPTTLLAQVDSSVGGKTGINLPGAKNMVGAFWQPAGVLIDVATLATLPDRELAAGLAEVVKYGVILDADFFAWLESQVPAIGQRDKPTLARIVARCCQLKADVVQADERETSGLRAILNYGHTFGHALEAVSGYGELLHGEGVAIGMMAAARLALRLGRIDEEFVARQERLLEALDLPIHVPPVRTDDLWAAMRRDKKAAAGKLRFILPTRLGQVELVGDVPEADVRAAWDATRQPGPSDYRTSRQQR